MPAQSDNEEDIQASAASSSTRDLFQSAAGFQASQALWVAAELGVADQLVGGRMSAAELAPIVRAQPGPLHRLLRTLASIGFFDVRNDKFGLTRKGELLTSQKGSFRDWILFSLSPFRWQMWGRLLETVRTGEPAGEAILGRNFFEHLRDQPELASQYDRAMGTLSEFDADAFLAAYRLDGVRSLVDLGGGSGVLLAKIVERYPGIQATLFDTPAVIEKALLPASVERVAGNFFESVPSARDVYLIKHVLHDWSDSDASRILRTIRTSIPPEGTLVLLEGILPEENVPSPVRWIDLTVLLLHGGADRTEREYRALLAATGFDLLRVVPTKSVHSVLEARPC